MALITMSVTLTIDGKRYTAHITPGEDMATMSVYGDRGHILSTFAPNPHPLAEGIEEIIATELATTQSQ